MKERTAHIIVTFHTTAEAMATEAACKKADLPGRLISAPRSLTADCGIAWCAPLSARGAIERAVEEAKIEVAGFYELEL